MGYDLGEGADVKWRRSVELGPDSVAANRATPDGIAEDAALASAAHRVALDSHAPDGTEIELAPESAVTRQSGGGHLSAGALNSEQAVARESDVIPLRELERRAIAHALQATGGNVGRAARLLGIGRATLYRRLAEPGANIQRHSVQRPSPSPTSQS